LTSDPTQSPTPAWPASPAFDPATPSAPSSSPTSSVFPPQFSQPGSEPEHFVSNPAAGNPTPLSNPIENNAPASWSQSGSVAAPVEQTLTTPTFVPSVDPSVSSSGLSTSPTVPDFLSNLSATPVATSATPPIPDQASNTLSALNQPNTPDAQATDLSQMTETSQNSTPESPVYTPTISNSETITTQTMPAGIPETINKNTAAGGNNKMKLLIICGAVIVLLTAAAGTYFFLISGKNSSEQNFSLPANQQAPLTTPAKQIIPTSPSPIATSSADATSSAFEKLKQDKTAK
jgi:hypothetical protein